LDNIISLLANAFINYALPAATVTALGWLVKSIKADRARQEAFEEGLKCLLRDRIIAAHRRHIIEGQAVTHEEYNSMQDMIKSYLALKGSNGYIERIAKEYTDAPVTADAH
jgi:hypothetical protein